MKRIFVIALFLIGASAHAQAPDSCIVTGYVYKADLSPAIGLVFTVKSVVKTGTIIGTAPTTYTVDSSGLLRMKLWRNSTTYIYADIAGYNANTQTGTAYAIPDSATAFLRYLQPVTTTSTIATLNNRLTAAESNIDSLLAGTTWADSDWLITPDGGYALRLRVGANDTLWHGMIVRADSLGTSDSLKVRRGAASGTQPIGVVYNPFNIAAGKTDTTVWIVVRGRADVLVETQDSVFVLRAGTRLVTSALNPGYAQADYDDTSTRIVAMGIEKYAIKATKVYVEGVIR